jgi:hypothetical protein
MTDHALLPPLPWQTDLERLARRIRATYPRGIDAVSGAILAPLVTRVLRILATAPPPGTHRHD